MTPIKESKIANLGDKTNAQEVNISTNTTDKRTTKDILPSNDGGKNPNPTTNNKIRQDIEAEDKSESKACLNLQGTRKFVPKSKEVPQVKEFKLDFTLSSEFTLSLRITQESNPNKLADYILSQIEFANPDYFNTSHVHQNILKNKYNTK